MSTFSARNGYKASELQFEKASSILKQRILSSFFKEEFDPNDHIDLKKYITKIESMMIAMGVSYMFPSTISIKQQNFRALERFICSESEWYTIFDFIERYLTISSAETASKMTSIFNSILEDEVSGYRIIDEQVVPIINEDELAAIKTATETNFESVNIHIAKARNLYANRRNPDYENSIKESISAVEAMCCIITGTSGANITLGKALKELRTRGIHIHSAMEKAFSSLYGYASNEDGIRHGGMDFANAPSEDAKYMLVSCSAFINYLSEKLSKINV